MHVWLCVYANAGPLELELQIKVLTTPTWVLGPELWKLSKHFYAELSLQPQSNNISASLSITYAYFVPFKFGYLVLLHKNVPLASELT